MVIRSKSIVVAALAVMMVGVLGLTACGGSSAPAGGSAGQAAKDTYVISKVNRSGMNVPEFTVNTLDSRGAISETVSTMNTGTYESVHTVNYALDKNGFPTSVDFSVKNNGEVTQTDSYTMEFVVNDKGLPEKATTSKGVETTYSYDANGNLESVVAKNANTTTTTTYNSDGYIVKREASYPGGPNPFTTVAEYAFENGKPVSYTSTDPNSTREYKVECDDNGNIVAFYQGDTKVATVEYTKVSNAYPFVAANSRAVTV